MGQAKERLLYDPPTDIEDDVSRWCFEQAELLRQRRFAEADLPNIIEELESMGQSERSAIMSSYRLVISHLLKWSYQPARRSRSWLRTIARERNNIEEREELNRSFEAEASRLVERSYRRACREAAAETGLPLTTFPFECPFTPDQIRDPDFLPE